MNILPVETLLTTIDEGEQFTFTFETLLEPDEILVSIEITDNDLPYVINVSGSTFSGNFYGLFDLPKNSLKYRQSVGDLISVSSFADLPPKGTADLYSYTPPSEMIKNFTITVVCKYMKGPVGAELPMELSKVYIQPVQGNWSIFTKMFLDYVR